ncbi:MAG: MerR family DNA-binding transcriptional regulator [Oxalobacteraceae bacterium]|nr:MerR family DNA-binding transcriptional regulator [Oxalobacteraceae bacterium]
MHIIGKVAALAGISADTLRYYEKERLVAPASVRRLFRHHSCTDGVKSS